MSAKDGNLGELYLLGNWIVGQLYPTTLPETNGRKIQGRTVSFR